MESSRDAHRCVICGLEYRHSSGLGRHYLSVHQMIRRNNSFVDVDADGLAQRLESLRRSQMSSRRRRRQARAVEMDRAPFAPLQVAAVRGSSSWAPEPSGAEDWEEWWDPSTFPELARDDPVSSRRSEVAMQTEAVFVSDVPPVSYEVGVQTVVPLSVDAATSTTILRPTWPTSIDFRVLTRFVFDRAHMSFDAMATELSAVYQNLSTEETILVRSAMSGIAWGLDFQASHILTAVDRIMCDPDDGPAHIAQLQSELIEQTTRRY